MHELLNKFDFRHPTITGEVLAYAVVLWLIVLGVVVSHILSHEDRPIARRNWILVVTLVPLLGVLAYLPFTFQAGPFLSHLPRPSTKRDS